MIVKSNLYGIEFEVDGNTVIKKTDRKEMRIPLLIQGDKSDTVRTLIIRETPEGEFKVYTI